MDAPLRLEMDEVVDDYPFTHPFHIEVDRIVLCRLIDFVCRQYEALSSNHAKQLTLHFPPQANWQRRIIFSDPVRLSDGRPLAVVGFFGRKRRQIAPEYEEEIQRLGEHLVAQFLNFPSGICYCTQLLSDELNYANLVLLDRSEAIAAWRDRPPHPAATAGLSPNYYAHVRIYNGVLPAGGIMKSQRLQFDHVKYWDYRADPIWHAVRQLSG